MQELNSLSLHNLHLTQEHQKSDSQQSQMSAMNLSLLRHLTTLIGGKLLWRVSSFKCGRLSSAR